MPLLVKKCQLSGTGLPFDIACEKLIARLKTDYVRKSSSRKLSQYEIVVDGFEPLTLLKRSTHQKKFYWSDRCSELAWAGIGSAVEFSESKFSAGIDDKIKTFLNEPQSAHQLFGAKRFDRVNSQPADDSFAQFPTSYFVLPILETRKASEVVKITLNVDTNDFEKTEEAILVLKQILAGANKKEQRNQLVSRAYVTGFERWAEQVNSILQVLKEQKAEKVVLANALDFHFEKPNDPVGVFEKICLRANSTYRYLFQLKNDCAFIGASPEQLFSRNNFRIESEAQAGTKRRGVNEAEDDLLSLELLNSTKEYNEHDVVLQDVWSHLSRLCRDCGWIDKRQIVKLQHVQHLRSRFGGILNDDVTDFEILNALHPTSAVCGMPKDVARNFIGMIEEFDRGYYCGPIGLVSPLRTEFAVALRSALMTGNRIRVFAGAGLVEGSNPKDEWNEIESKMRPFNEIFMGEV